MLDDVLDILLHRFKDDAAVRRYVILLNCLIDNIIGNARRETIRPIPKIVYFNFNSFPSLLLLMTIP